VLAQAIDPAEKFTFVHSVLERFSAINEHDWHFVIESTAELLIGVHVDLAPVEAAPPVKFHQAFLHDLAQMTAFASVKLHIARFGHGRRV
jgi:hypothetical protein